MRPATVSFLSFFFSACVAVAAGPADPLGLSREEVQEGFVSLFDGKTLEGWQGSTGGYVPESGVLVCQPKGGGKLFTTKEYGNFILRFEFKLEPGGNNGIAIRSPLEGRPSRDGMEIQILDDDHPKYAKLGTYQYHGSIYGMVPAKRGHLRPAGEWNTQEIVCDGSRIQVTLNGAVIVDADLKEITDPTLDGYPHPGRHREKGFLGFIGHGTRVEFRKIRVKEL
ncbi:MAG: DUF1080 domain-containing protein [Pirellulales bacterium]|nr:DUF1080 domain-containing protein [Pirellulales bacterium]